MKKRFLFLFTYHIKYYLSPDNFVAGLNASHHLYCSILLSILLITLTPSLCTKRFTVFSKTTEKFEIILSFNRTVFV